MDLGDGSISPADSFSVVNATGIIATDSGVLVVTDESVDLWVDGRVTGRAFHSIPTLIKWFLYNY
jgi:hypothetical protein